MNIGIVGQSKTLYDGGRGELVVLAFWHIYSLKTMDVANGRPR